MNGSMARRVAISACLFGCFAASYTFGDDPGPATADPAPGIQSLIEEVSSSSRDARYQAMDALVAAGQPAVAPLARAVQERDPASAPRFLRVLTDLSLDDDLALATAAEDALRDLARIRLSPESAVAVSRANHSRRRIAAEKLRDLGGHVFFEDSEAIEVVLNEVSVSNGDLRWIRGFGRLTDLSLEGTGIGDPAMQFLPGLSHLEWLNLYRTDVGDASLVILKKLPALRFLPIGRTRVTDAGLEPIGQMRQLKYLGLRGTRIDGSGLVKLQHLAQLEGLHLGETAVTDETLEPLVALVSLRRLWLHDTRISDAAIPHLARMSGLRELHLARTRMTSAGLERLRISIPNCRVFSE